MPTEAEIKSLVGDAEKPSEDSSNNKPQVSYEEYRAAIEAREKAEKNYENLRSLENKRDREIRELRESAKSRESKPLDEEGDEDEIDSKIAKAMQSQEDKIRDRVRREIAVENRAKDLQGEVSKVIEEKPYVNPQEVVEFLTRNPNMSTERALWALYPEQMTKSIIAPDITETDSGGRTIAVKPNPTEENGVPQKRGFGRMKRGEMGSTAGVISRNIQKRLDDSAGVR